MITLHLYDIFAWYLEALARGTLSVVLAGVQINGIENVCVGDLPISSVVLHADSVACRPTNSFDACKYRRSIFAFRPWAAHHSTTTCSSSAVSLFNRESPE